MIAYAKSFRENVKGTVHAAFKLDSQGRPEFEEDDEGTKHYEIELSLQSPQASVFGNKTCTKLQLRHEEG